jgi:RNA polymerase sigma factor (TIGR02999 family)
MSDHISELLSAARAGDERAAKEAFSLLYAELHRLAQARLRPHQTMTLLNTTSLVHESFLRMVGGTTLPLEDRHHFFAYASSVMRSVIVDFARSRMAARRGGEAEHVLLDTALSDQLAAPEHDALRVHEALETLEQAEPRLAQVAEMRFFGGLSEAEIAAALGVSERTVRRDWEKARLLLLAAMG